MQPASSQSAFEWEGGSIDELIQMLTAPAMAVRVEVRTPSAGKPKKVGEIHLVAGGVSDVLAGELRGDDAMEHLRGVSPLSFRVQPRLPNPEDGNLLVPGPSEGTLAERPPAEVMRYAELYVLTCVIHIWRDTDRAEIAYRKGEIARTIVNGIDAPEQLHEVMNWASGGYRIVLPELSLPAPPSRTPQPQTTPAARPQAAAVAPARPVAAPAPAPVAAKPTPAPAQPQPAPAPAQKAPAPLPAAPAPAPAMATAPAPAAAQAPAKTMFGIPAAMLPSLVQTAAPAAAAAPRGTQRRAPDPEPVAEKRGTSSGMRVDLYDKKEPERTTNMGVPAVANAPAQAVRNTTPSHTAQKEESAPTKPQEDLTTLPAPAKAVAKPTPVKAAKADTSLQSHQPQKSKQKKKTAQKSATPATTDRTERTEDLPARPPRKAEMSIGAHIGIGLALGLSIAAIYWLIQIFGGG